MDVLHLTGRKRETYTVKFEYSILWECALGIAAITNKPLLKTLEKSPSYWEELRSSLPKQVQEQLEYVESNNTWKALLQLLHQSPFHQLSDFLQYINDIPNEEFKFICLPYIGEQYQELRQNVANGDQHSVIEMQTLTKDNSFFPKYIEFINLVEIPALRAHLAGVMEGWYKAVIEKDSEELTTMLKTDYDSKKNMAQISGAEELVEWATGGVTYRPEPSVKNVLLIPQYIYRPWNIEADIEGTKVFYYPIANESISPSDRYAPDNFLVLRYKALGDEARLRMIKLLFEHDRTLQEITDQLDLGKSTIHHHLKILRAAKLVEINHGKYSVKKNVVESLPEELSMYLAK